MDTATHAIVNLAILGHVSKWKHLWSIFLGGIVSDVPMFLFFFYHKLVGTPEWQMWRQEYYREGWQMFFDVFNSIPIATALFVVGLWKKWRALQFFALSVILHAALDLPVHVDDGHRHFLPFSTFRFESPVSYWDREFHGHTIGLLGIVVTLFAGIYVFYKVPSRTFRVVVVLSLITLVLPMLYFTLVFS